MKIHESPFMQTGRIAGRKELHHECPAPQDTFVKTGARAHDAGRAEKARLRELQSLDGESINTSWGFGANENRFNTIILQAVRDKWGSMQPALPPLLLKATIAKESSFNPSTVSPTGYVGLMQLGRGEALSQGLKLEPVDERYIPEKNVPAGVGVLKIKHGVVSDPLAQYPNEPWARNIAAYYREHGAPTTLQLWHLSLGAYNGGGATMLRAMDYAQKDGRDPRAWSNLLEPKDAPVKSPLYKGLVDVYGEKFALSKYYETGRYPVKILQIAGMITAEEAAEQDLLPPDFEPGDDRPVAPADWKALIQKVKNGDLSSDKDLDDPLPALHRQGTHKVVDESRDSLEAEDRTYGHTRVNGAFFDVNGNWADFGTAVAADQYAGMTEAMQAEFLGATTAKPEEVTPGDAAVMLHAPSESWDDMVAPKPDITYRKIDYSAIGEVKIEPKYLVMHYTGYTKDTPDGVWSWFNQKKGRPSTHFIVGKEGDILQTMPETQKCSGTLHFNSESVQIEVCGNFREKKETDEEFDSATALVKYLQKKYHIPDTHIISHRQVDNNTGHVGRKPDPGFRFMNRLYDALR